MTSESFSSTVILDSRVFAVRRPWGEVADRARFSYLSQIAADSEGRVLICKRQGSPVVVFDRDGGWLGGWGDDRLRDPHGIYVDHADRVFVVDRDSHEVVAFDCDGTELLAIGTRDHPRWHEPFNHPTGVAVSRNSGEIFVSDGYGNARIHRFGSDGAFITSWGGPGVALGQFMTPHALWVDAADRIFVADRENSRIQVFDPNGTQLAAWGGVWRPMAICGFGEDAVLVTDQVPSVAVFSLDGQLRSRCRPAPYSPHGIWSVDPNTIYLVEPWPTDTIIKLEAMRNA